MIKRNEIIIYTDGGSRNNGEPDAISGYGIIIMYGSYTREMIGAKFGSTNNQMEMKSVIESMKVLKPRDVPVVVHTDSNLIIQTINKKWYVNWVKNGWKKSNKKPVENKALWEELLGLYKEFDNIKFVKVKGHDTDKYNNRADELANIAMDELALNPSIAEFLKTYQHGVI